MISVDDYAARVLALVAPLAPRRIALADALGLVLAEPIHASRDLPPFDNSAMDGYAVRAADTAATPVTLTVIGELAAGATPTTPVAPSTAIRIMTGAPMPAGADAVVPVERTDGGTSTVRIDAPANPGAHIRRAGEDLAAGALAVPAGTQVTSRTIAVIASCDRAHVLVHPRPRVAVISTGDELVTAGDPVGPGQIVDSNGPLLAAAILEAGADVTRMGPIADTDDAVRAALLQAADIADLIVTSGGVSMGAYDTMKAVLTEAGGVEFAKVAMNPGMPQGCGTVHGTPIITLPGNPVSSYVSFELYVRPVLRRMQGHTALTRPLRTATLTAPIDSPANKRQFARGVLNGEDVLTVAPVSGQGSHVIGGLAQANCLLVLDVGVDHLDAGAPVPVMDLR